MFINSSWIKRSDAGSVIIVVVVALIALTALAAGMSKTSMISNLNQLEFNQANIARNMEASGQEYVKGVAYVYQGDPSKTFADFKAKLLENSGEVSLGDDVGSFVVSVSEGTPSGSATPYGFKVIGKSPSGSLQAQYETPIEVSMTYTLPETHVNNFEDYVIISGGAVKIAGNAKVVGDVYAAEVEIDQTSLTGDVTSAGATKMNYKAVLDGNMCSVGAITFAQAAQVSGDVRSNSDIELLHSNTVGGSVYSDGSVTITDQSRVAGNVHAASAINMGYRSVVFNNAYTLDNLTMSGGGEAWKSGPEPSKHGATIVNNAYVGKEVTVGTGTSIQGTSFSLATPTNNGYINKKEKAGYPPPDTNKNIKPSGLPVSCNTLKMPASTKFDPPESPSGLDLKQKSCTSWSTISYSGTASIVPGWYCAPPDAPNGKKQENFPQYSTITLTAGTYYFEELYFGYAVKLILDVSAGDILIFVKGSTDLKSPTTINTRIDKSKGGVYIKNGKSDPVPFASADKELAAKVYLEAHNQISLEYSSNWFGTLFSTKAISFSGDNSIVGVYASLEAEEISWSANITYVQSNYAANNW
jgi:cytoskeletal protein CcmA (bactofilin family)